MGKRSSHESKLRRKERQQIKNILLTYSFRDRIMAETVYTKKNEPAVEEHLKAALGFTQTLAEYGEVLMSPLGESPTVQQLGAPD